MDNVVTRFAPSPTGNLHIGGIRSALYPFALAKRFGGKFILRIEDTDQTRKVMDGDQAIMNDLKEYGLEWDELYYQSQRVEIYQKYAKQLVEQGSAFYSFETKQQLAEARKLAELNKQPFRYRSPDRDLPLATAQKRVDEGESYVIRLKTPDDEELHYKDLVQGSMRFNTKEVDDTVLLKSDGFPTYHLAVVVDDHLMGVTHVLRGFGWIPSIPKHILIYRAFGWQMPFHGHLTDILNPDGKGKLSKRFGAVSAKSFVEQGYLTEAVLNYLMLLGWSSPEKRVHGEKEREIFSLKDFIEIFDLKDLNKSNQKFDPAKLLWFNQQYMHAMPIDQFQNRFLEWLKIFGNNASLQELIVEKGPDYLQQALILTKDRVQIFLQLPDMIELFYKRPTQINYTDVKQLKDLTAKDAKLIVEDFVNQLDGQNSMQDWPHEEWEAAVRNIANRYEFKHGAVFMLLRLVVTGTQFSPPLYELMVLLGKDEVLKRLRNFLI